MSTSIEDRLVAHFADRAANEPLPGPEADVALERARQRGPQRVPRARGGAARLLRPRIVLAAAAVLVVAMAGALLLADDEPSRVRTTVPSMTTKPDRGAVPPQTASTSPSNSPTSVLPAAGAEPAGPIVAVEGVLGTWSGSDWVRWGAGDTPPSGDEYQIVRLDEPITTAAGAVSPVLCSVEGEAGVDVGLEFSDDPLVPLPIAVAGVTDPRPRAVEVLDPASPVYREAAVAVLAGLGLTDADPGIGQVVRGDLDGDGAAEVLVVAERLTDPDGLLASDGDYSVAFLRRVVGGAVETTVVASSLAVVTPGATPFIEAYRVAALADLNGDGLMEVVVNGRYYEGSSAVVYELQPNGTLIEILSAGCGA